MMIGLTIKSLQSKLILFFVLLCLLPLSVVAWIAYDQGQTNLKESLGSKLEELAAQTIGKIDHVLYTSQVDLQNWSLAEVMQDVIVDDADGRMTDTLIRLQKSSKTYSLILSLNADGIVIASSDPQTLGLDLSHEIPLSFAGNSRQVVVGHLHNDPLLKDYAISITAPILDTQDPTQHLGYLAARVSWQELMKWMHKIRVNENGQTTSAYAVLLNQKGELISVPEFMSSRSHQLILKENWVQRGFESAGLGVQGKQGSLIERAPNGREVLVGFAGSQGHENFSGLGWAVLIVHETHEAFAPVAELRNKIMGVTAVVGVLVIFLAVGFSRRISIPIRELTTHAQQVAGGDLSPAMPRVSNDEIGDLAEAFSRMTHDLRDSTKALVNAREENIIRSMADSLMLLNEDGTIRTVNQATLTMLGYEKEQLLGKPIKTVIESMKEQQEVRGKAEDHLLDDGKEEMLYVRKDGNKVPVLVSKAILRDQQGQMDGLVWVASDITDRMQIESRLLQAKQQAEEAVRMKSEFLATMSHEIRTPMNGVIGMTGLLLDTNLTSHQQHLGATIRSSGEALLTIINDILDFSKIESGKLEFEMIDFDLRNAVEESLELFAEKAGEKGLELVALFSAHVPMALKGDPGRLRQILVNLIGNGIKFTETGEITVKVERVNETNQHVLLRFIIRDTGIGISKEGEKKLFQPFSQTDSSTTRKYGGTGLGLAICHQLVDHMDGEIGVESQPGQGSEFWFTIKLEKQPPESLSDITPLSSLQGIRICCVDDNATNRELLAQLTASWGMESAIVETPAEALGKLKEAANRGQSFDVAILDMEMPGMDGMTLARTISTDPQLAPVRLVLLTSLGRRGDGQAAQEAGFVGYLTKPVRKSLLHQCLSVVMGHSNQEDETFASPLITRHNLKETVGREFARILVAEDHVVNQQLAVMMLEKFGHRADVVANGQEAVEATERVQYDLVLMDCQMPEMDGYTATQAIRHSEDSTRHLPIIAMTANAMSGDREKCLAAGMDDYITKPVKPERLQETLTRWLPTSGKNVQGTWAKKTVGEAHEPIEDQKIGKLVTPPDNGLRSHHSDGVPHASPVIEPAVIESLRELVGANQPNRLAEIVQQFIKDAKDCATAIEEAIENEQTDALARAAHGLKGISQNMGAGRLSDICFQIEQNGKAGALEGMADQLAMLQQELTRVNHTLTKEFVHKS